MQSEADRLAVTAHNIANLNTEGFAPRDARQPNQKAQAANTVFVNQPTESLIATNQLQADAPGPDLAREALARITAVNAYKANAAVFRASDETTETLINGVV